MSYKDSKLWKNSFGSISPANDGSLIQLSASLDSLRENVEQLASQIENDVPVLTDHSVRHLDALWHLASRLIDPTRLNPAEVYVFGGAILLHDLGNCLAAYENWRDEIFDNKWEDLVHGYYRTQEDRAPEPEEIENPPKDVRDLLLLRRLREAHGEQAKNLATAPYYSLNSDNNGEPAGYLIENKGLRGEFGELIGLIAASHHWSINKVIDTFDHRTPITTTLEEQWEIDSLVLAALLRTSDIAQVDARRTPRLAMTTRRLPDESKHHWLFQSRLQAPKVTDDTRRLRYLSNCPFEPDEAEAWWLAYETLSAVDEELRSVDEMLVESRGKECRLAAAGVEGINSPDRLCEYIRTSDWTPVDVRIRATDVVGLIEEFGTDKLYGDDYSVPLRESIANACDAVRARRAATPVDEDYGKVIVRFCPAQDEKAEPWLEIEDDGIGMSRSVAAGPLLDFGSTYWTSHLARREHPGLFSEGFEPTGKFGIGFFSTFMLGSRVKVTSCPLRPHLAGEIANPEPFVLDFKGGITQRPVLRKPTLDEQLPGTGTRVRVELKDRAANYLAGSWKRVSAHRRKVEPADGFSELLSRLLPSSDVDVEFEVYNDGRCTVSDTVVEAHDWTTASLDELACRTFGPDTAKNPVASREFDIEDETVARLWLPRPRGGATLSLGGLATKTILPLFGGVIEGKEPDLQRQTAALTVPTEQLHEWLSDTQLQQRVSEALGDRWQFHVQYARFFLSLGLIPNCFRFVRTPNSLLSPNQITEDWAKSPRRIVNSTDTLILVDPNVERDVSFRKLLNEREAKFDDDVVFVQTRRPRHRDDDYVGTPNVVLPEGPDVPSTFPHSLVEVLIAYMLKLTDSTKELADFRSDRGTLDDDVGEIGSYRGHVPIQDLYVRVNP